MNLSHNPHLERAHNLRNELRTLQAGDEKILKQIFLSILYRICEILAGEKLPR